MLWLHEFAIPAARLLGHDLELHIPPPLNMEALRSIQQSNTRHTSPRQYSEFSMVSPEGALYGCKSMRMLFLFSRTQTLEDFRFCDGHATPRENNIAAVALPVFGKNNAVYSKVRPELMSNSYVVFWL